MTNKRKAHEAFGQSTAFISAFAAARGAKESTKAKENVPEQHGNVGGHDIQTHKDDLVTTLAKLPYDGRDTEEPERIAPVQLGSPSPQNILSTWTRRQKNVLRDDRIVEISMANDELATFVGEYILEVTSGVVSIYGAVLRSSSGLTEIHALSTSPLPAITAKKDGTKIMISPVQHSIACLAMNSPLFRNIGITNDQHGRSFVQLPSSAHDPLQRTLVPLELDEDTKKVLFRINARSENIERPPRILAVGPKSAGKSTFNRFMCNMLVTRPGAASIAFLDIDPGQPEFGPPGQVSLVEIKAPVIGPPFTHLAAAHSNRFTLVRSHTIAATSFKDDPEHYIKCVTDLSRRVAANVPLVVNTCGWVSGLGGFVLLEVARHLRITDAVFLLPVDNDLQQNLGALVEVVHTLPRRQTRHSLRTPTEQRAMQTIAYFHQKRSSFPTTIWDNQPLSSVRPWLVSYKGESAGITAILSYGQAPATEFLRDVLDGMLVAIVVTDPDLITQNTIQRTPKEELPYITSPVHASLLPLDPSHSRFIALALIRGIDVEAGRMHLLTPLPDRAISELSREQVVLVRGGFDCPDWAYLESIYNKASTSSIKGRTKTAVVTGIPWVSLREPVGVEGSVWRLRHPPVPGDDRR